MPAPCEVVSLVASGAKAPGVSSRLSNRVTHLFQKLILDTRLSHCQPARIAGQAQCPIQFEMRESTHVVKIQCIGATGVVDIVDVILRELGGLFQDKTWGWYAAAPEGRCAAPPAD